MLAMTVKLDGNGILKDYKGEVVHVKSPLTVTTLAGGMDSGKPSVAIIADLPDGRKLIMETSAELFCNAANIIKTKYRDKLEVI